MPTIRIVNYPVYYPVKSDNPPDNPPDRPPERRWPWSASARLPPSTTLGATFKQGRTRSRCHLDYFGNGTARRRNTAVTVRKGMGGGSRTEVAVRRFAPYPASSTRSAPPLCEAWPRVRRPPMTSPDHRRLLAEASLSGPTALRSRRPAMGLRGDGRRRCRRLYARLLVRWRRDPRRRGTRRPPRTARRGERVRQAQSCHVLVRLMRRGAVQRSNTVRV